MNSDGTSAVKLTSEPQGAFQPNISPDGSKIVYHAQGATGAQFDLVMINVDGSGRVQLTNSPSFDENNPEWGPDGKTIVYGRRNTMNSAEDIFVVDSVTKASLQVTNLGDATLPTWDKPDSVIFFHRVAGWFSINSDSTNLSGVLFPAGITVFKGGALAHWLLSNFNDEMDLSRNTTTTTSVVPTGVDQIGGFSPDARQGLFSVDGPSTVRQLDRVDLADNTVTPITHDVADYSDPVWGPAPKETILVGTSTALQPTASAVIFSQAGDLVTGVVAFKATTQSTVVLASPASGNAGPNIVYTADADNISSLTYANGTFFKPVVVIGPGGNIGNGNGAIVSFNSTTGKVVNVLAFAGSRGPKPTVQQTPDETVIRGSFNAVFDGNGKNLSNGATATEVHISKTGQVTFH
jgi:dipeptidyl aminopeptidase/acylaminoacyl peptidase